MLEEKMKNIFSMFVVIMLVLGLGVTVSSAADKISVCIDGEVVDFSSTGQEPILENGRTLIPFKQAFESLGYTVNYDQTTKSATMSKDNVSVTIWQGKTDFQLSENGIIETKQLDVAAKITPTGRFVIPIKPVCEALGMEVIWENDYRAVFIFSDNNSKTNKETLIEKAKPKINPIQYNKDNALFQIEKGYGDGFIDKNGNIVIQPDKNIRSYEVDSEGFIEKFDPETKLTGYIDRTGEFQIKPQFYNTFPFSDGVAVVQYPDDHIEQSGDGSQGYLWRSIDNYSLIDNKGNKLFKFPEGVSPYEYHEGYCRVAIPVGDGFKYNYMDKTGKFINSEKYWSCGPFSDGAAVVGQIINGDQKYGVIDKNGKEILPIKYNDLGNFSGGLAKAFTYVNGQIRYGFIDKSGNWAIKPIYVVVQEEFSEGLVGVKTSNEEWMFIDNTGKTAIKLPGYILSTGIGEKGFSDGIAKVAGAGGIRYIDKNGNLISNEAFGLTSRSCENGLIRVTPQWTIWESLPFKYIDKKGNIVFDNTYPE
jgi:hypothetical protein